MATQNPIESEGTYPLPEAQIDRFMLKILIGYPTRDEELTIVQRQLDDPPELREIDHARGTRGLQRDVHTVYADPALDQLRDQPRRRDPQPGRATASRTGAVHLLRREPARADQPDRRRERARTRSTAATSSPRRHQRARRRRAPAPARPLLPGAGGGGGPGLDSRARPAAVPSPQLDLPETSAA